MMLVSRSGSVLLLSGGLESGLATRVAGTLLAVDVERERERTTQYFTIRGTAVHVLPYFTSWHAFKVQIHVYQVISK